MIKKLNNVYGDVIDIRLVDTKSDYITVAKFPKTTHWEFANTEPYGLTEECIDMEQVKMLSLDLMKHDNAQIEQCIDKNVLEECFNFETLFSAIEVTKRDFKITHDYEQKTIVKIIGLCGVNKMIWIFGPKSCIALDLNIGNGISVITDSSYPSQLLKSITCISSPYALNIPYNDYIICIPKDKFTLYHTPREPNTTYKFSLVSNTEEKDILIFPINII